MNAILQKRIEEAARYIAELCPDCDLHCKGTNPCIPKILYQKLIEISIFALQNQWISVEEALPEEDIPKCFVTYKTLDMVFYSTGSYEKDNDEWYVDSVGFNVKVTHWMEVPSLKRGKK